MGRWRKLAELAAVGRWFGRQLLKFGSGRQSEGRYPQQLTSRDEVRHGGKTTGGPCELGQEFPVTTAAGEEPIRGGWADLLFLTPDRSSGCYFDELTGNGALNRLALLLLDHRLSSW